MEKISDYKVSIIVPIYNVEKYLRRALDSLLAQTLDNIEIILVDDGSLDASGKIIDEYAGKCENILALHKKNGGQSDARNAGMRVASGEYIGFIDPDDYVETDMFAKLYYKIKSADADLAICGYYEEFPSATPVNKTVGVEHEHTQVDAELLISSFIECKYGAYAWNKLYKKKIIDDQCLQFPCGIMLSEDTVFYCNYLEYVKKAIVIEECLYHYMRNEESICAKFHEQQLEYYRAGNEAKKMLIQTMEEEKRTRLNTVNDIVYLKTCLNVLDQLNSMGNKAGLRMRYLEMVRICKERDIQELIPRYADRISDKELIRKIAYIKKGRMRQLFLYENLKMRVIARIKYYFG